MYYFVDMAEVAYTESKKDLLEAAKKARFEVSERQLVRWQNSGLLQRPRRRFLGRGLGSEAVYPEGSMERLLAICRIRETYGEKRLDYVLWRLWWEGHDVDIKRVRRFLRKIAGHWADFNKWSIDAEETGLSKVAKKYIKESGDRRFRNTALSRTHGRVKKERYPDFMRTLFEVGTGHYTPDAPQAMTNQFLVETGLGMHGSRTDNVADTEEWLKVGERLSLLSEFLKDDPVTVYARVKDEELIQARQEITGFLRTIENLVQMAEAVAGKDAFGLSQGLRMIQEVDPASQAILLLFWITFRKSPQGLPSLKTFNNSDAELERVSLLQKALDDLRREIPALADALSPKETEKGIHAFLFNEPRAKDGYISKLEKVNRENERELAEFWNRHPEYKVLLPEGKS